MFFSILVAVHNVEKYINKCIDSLLRQNFDDYEIILVNDGSTDSSGAICDDYAGRFPEKIQVYHRDNHGLLLTRRFGISKASGEYILFVDSDDYVETCYLEKIYKSVLKYDCDLLIFHYWRFEDGTDEFQELKPEYPDGTVFEGKKKTELYKDFVINHRLTNMWRKAVKASVIDSDYDYKEWNVSRNEDVIQSFNLFERAKKIVFTDERLYYYRKSSSGVTRKVRTEDADNQIMCAKRSLLFISKWDFDTDTAGRYYATQMNRFFSYLRDIERVYGNNKEFYEVVCKIGLDQTFKKVAEKFSPEYCHKRLRFRLSLFRKMMLKEKWKRVYTIVHINNRIASGL